MATKINIDGSPLLKPEIIKERLHKLEEAWASLAIEDFHVSDDEKNLFVQMVRQGYTDEQIGQQIDRQLEKALNG